MESSAFIFPHVICAFIPCSFLKKCLLAYSSIFLILSPLLLTLACAPFYCVLIHCPAAYYLHSWDYYFLNIKTVHYSSFTSTLLLPCILILYIFNSHDNTIHNYSCNYRYNLYIFHLCLSMPTLGVTLFSTWTTSVVFMDKVPVVYDSELVWLCLHFTFTFGKYSFSIQNSGREALFFQPCVDDMPLSLGFRYFSWALFFIIGFSRWCILFSLTIFKMFLIVFGFISLTQIHLCACVCIHTHLMLGGYNLAKILGIFSFFFDSSITYILGFFIMSLDVSHDLLKYFPSFSPWCSRLDIFC